VSNIPEAIMRTRTDFISPHSTGSNPNNQSTNKTHAKDGGNASVVPQKIQEKLPEAVERAVPNALHDTGDK
jgi:hypothetical protein